MSNTFDWNQSYELKAATSVAQYMARRSVPLTQPLLAETHNAIKEVSNCHNAYNLQSVHNIECIRIRGDMTM